MNKRPSLGFDDDEIEQAPAAKPADVLDLSDFKPAPIQRPDQAAIDQAARKANFKSRESKLAAAETFSPAPQAPPRLDRRRRTGRSAQLNIKIRADTMATFYAIADAQGWVLGEAFERAVALLEKDVAN